MANWLDIPAASKYGNSFQFALFFWPPSDAGCTDFKLRPFRQRIHERRRPMRQSQSESTNQPLATHPVAKQTRALLPLLSAINSSTRWEKSFPFLFVFTHSLNFECIFTYLYVQFLHILIFVCVCLALLLLLLSLLLGLLRKLSVPKNPSN